MKKYTLFVSLIAVILLIGCTATVKNERNFADEKFTLEIGDKKIVVPSDKWTFVENLDETIYSKNYSAIKKSQGEIFEQIVTVFLNKMTDDRKIGEKISNSEYIEAFVFHPNSITVQIRIDKGDYWVMSRQTFESNNDYANQTNVQYKDLISNFEEMQNKIDNTRYILNNDF